MKRIVIFVLFSFVITGFAMSQYCQSEGNTSYNTSVTRVIFNTIDNSTGKTNAYEDYTYISTQVNIGSTYLLTVNVNTDGGYTVYAKVWIDWNGDGDFADAGEEYDMGSATGVSDGPTSNSPLSVTVPTSATPGTTRMRVAARYYTSPGPCETGYDGEVEDYSIVIPALPIFHNSSSNAKPVFF